MGQMAWKMYRVTFRLLAPLYVGWFKQGNVQRTRPYVTGKTLWGALTARLTREGGTGNYQQIGQEVSQRLAFSYFYPSNKSDCVMLWPWEKPDEFAWLYLNTYVSTALNYEQNSAEEGSLHETEYIAPYTREGEPVYLIGYIFEQQECSLKWKDVLSRLQLGGERTYGWGRVQVQDDPQEAQNFWPGWKVDLTGPRPRLEAQAEATLYAHLFHSDSLLNLCGALEPLVGRETGEADQFGRRIVPLGLAWAPGARLMAPHSLQIANFGLWQIHP